MLIKHDLKQYTERTTEIVIKKYRNINVCIRRSLVVE